MLLSFVELDFDTKSAAATDVSSTVTTSGMFYVLFRTI